jgi:signal transduction histidine kinase/CheY-like chemotaxis protein/AraC-like DNA-binding protein
MNLVFPRISLILFFLAFLLSLSVAQPERSAPSVSEEIYQQIETRLEQASGDTTARQIILELVRDRCGSETQCLLNIYGQLLEKLEKDFRLLSGIIVAEEMARLSAEQQNVEAEAKAYEKLAELYSILEIRKTAGIYQDKALALYQAAGNLQAEIEIRSFQAEAKAWYLGEAREALEEMEEFLAKAIKLNFPETANRLRIRMKYICEENVFQDKLLEQIEALESIPLSDPMEPSEYPIAFHAAAGRGDLYRQEGNYARAREYYQKALGVFQTVENSFHDHWLEVYALQRLAELEWQWKKPEQAKGWLEQAYTICDKYDMHSALIKALTLGVEIAEARENYADAFHYTREIMDQQAILEGYKEEFDMQKDVLQRERDKLEVEKAGQATELRLRKGQLMYTIVIIVLTGLLAIGLFIGFYKQRQGKRKLTARNRLIQQQTEQLKQLDAAKSLFFANVNHELRTPLTLMLGPVKMLLKGEHNARERENLLKMAVRSGEQLQRLVNEILDLRKLDMGKMQLQTEATLLVPFFDQYAAQFESLAADNQIDYSYETQMEKGVRAMIDREKLRQILNNLLSNAFKYTPSGGRIEAALSLHNHALTLEVSDTGSGIEPDDLPHVFDRYFQSSAPGKAAEGGTGIGLALCKEYAQLFNGTIEVESEMGKGSLFRLAFPVQLTESQEAGDKPLESASLHESIPSAEERAAAVISGDTPAPTLLIVEDNADLREYLRLSLGEKYRILAAENGKKALEILEDGPKDQKIQLIISDLMMPVMDGYQLLEKLKKQESTRHIPVIMLTARAGKDDRLKALRIGVDDYLTKPFDAEELRVRIANLLAKQSAREKIIQEEEHIPEASPFSGADQEWLERFETYIKNNLDKDYLTIPLIAREFTMSESSLLRKVRRLTGLSPKQYLKEIRLDYARSLLDTQAFRSIAQVAAKAGFSNSRSFTRNFRERYGKPPSDYLNN